MGNVRTSRRALRSVAALAAGLSTIVVLSIATDAALYASGVFSQDGKLMTPADWVLAIAYRAGYTILGCWLAARLARDRRRQHAMALGLLGLLLGLVGAIATWDRGPDFGPKWYPLAVMAMTIPCAWLGGRLADAGDD